ncbi:MAG: malonyl-CoA decarboxylase [Beijerinckiaceae bacterium]
MKMQFLNDLIDTVTERGRRLLALEPRGGRITPDHLLGLSAQLLSMRGEATGIALAQSILDGYAALTPDAQRGFLKSINDTLGPDDTLLARAIAAHTAAPTAQTARALHDAAEPKRQEWIRRLNMAPRGTLALVRMREDVLAARSKGVDLEALDADFLHLLSSWFNRGFLELRPIDWSTPANILEKIIRYEAVHEIQDWDDLRRRLAPVDRRCFGFFHPRLTDEPLIFVEVALMAAMPDAIQPLLAKGRAALPVKNATTAVFYSISNCQPGLAGVSFGNFLIKQVVDELRRDNPAIKNFVTLSPVPGFAAWLEKERANPQSVFISDLDRNLLNQHMQPGWDNSETARAALREPLLSLAAHYFLKARDRKNRTPDPVARFHLGNGARLERLNFLGDMSAKSLAQSHGLMVNYLYDLDTIIENHERFANDGTVMAASGVRKRVRE